MAKKTDLSRVPTSELLRVLERRQAMVGELEARRDALQKELAEIAVEISALEGGRKNGVAPARVKRSAADRTRLGNKQPLHAILCDLLKGRTMSVAEIAEAVQKSGYKSNAAKFGTIVNLTLLKRKDLFKRVERGRYTAK